MKEYIERAATLDICQKEYEDRLGMADYCGDTVAYNIAGAIKSIPTADVVEVQHGRWSPVAFGIGICTTKYRCSICKQYENVDRAYKYCPNCGARMDAKGG